MPEGTSVGSDGYRTFLVVNPRSGGGFTGRCFGRIAEHVRANVGDFEFGYTERPGHATVLTRDALKNGYEMIIAVGGDGTFNEVVNGFFEGARPTNPDAVFGIIPRGTGGDLRRTLGVPKDLRAACAVLAGPQKRCMDVGHMTFTSHEGRIAERVFINIASFGVAGLVVDRVNKATKILGGRASFMIGSVKALMQYRDQMITLRLDERDPFTVPITALAICNGRYFGGGMQVAPGAVMDDGEFDVTTWAGFKLKDFVLSSRMLYDGTHLQDARTRSDRCKVIRLESEETVLIDMDGEQPGRLPAEITLIPRALKVKC